MKKLMNSTYGKMVSMLSIFLVLVLFTKAQIVVVKPADVGVSWFSGAPADTRPGGSVTLVDGPGITPLGCGSVQMTTANSSAKAQFMNYSHIGTPLSAINAMSYWAYKNSSSTNSANQTIGLNIEIDINGGTLNPGEYSTLVFEPTYQAGGVGAMLTNTWQLWDAFNGGNAIWWSTRTIPGAIGSCCGGPSFVTWNTILANNPNATILGAFGFNIGSGWAGQFTGAADALTINTTTYNFELSPNNVINTNTGRTYCTIQSAISDANTLNGHNISVGAGTYNENITVSKGLTINGANANLACGSRVAESVLAPASGVPVTITADGVTLNGFELTAPSSTYAIVGSGRSNQGIIFNNIHDVGTTVTNANVHAYVYLVANAPTAATNVTVSDNCFNNISSSSLIGWSSSAIGILQSPSTGTLTGLNIERNTINKVNVNNGQWPTGKIAYGIQLNAGSASYQTTTGKIVNAVIKNNEISNLSGHISTGIALEGNTENAVVENNSVANLSGTKNSGTRAGGGYDLNGLKFESNRFVATVTVKNNSFQTNTFTHSAGSGIGYAVSNYVPSSLGTATLNCNWYGTNVYNDIVDNVTFTGKIFNKDLCQTIFVPYLSSGTDASPAIGFQTNEVCSSCPATPCTINVNPSPAVAGHAPNTIYRGYGPSSVVLTAEAGASYLWSTAAITQSISVSPIVTTNYSVTVKYANGCTSTCSVTITVIDVRCGNKNDKVTVCHNGKENCISPNAVPAHLAHGDVLGPCAVSPRPAAGSEFFLQETKPSIYPNPSTGNFTIRMNTKSKSEIVITNSKGAVIERRAVNSINAGQTQSFDLRRNGPGMYFIRIVSAEGVQTTKVIVQR